MYVFFCAPYYLSLCIFIPIDLFALLLKMPDNPLAIDIPIPISPQRSSNHWTNNGGWIGEYAYMKLPPIMNSIPHRWGFCLPGYSY